MSKWSPKFNRQVAIVLLARGLPIPVDLQATLIEQGIDVAELERRRG